MPDTDPIPEPWQSFLRELDQVADGPVDFYCIGGFVVTRKYGLIRETSDIDVLAIAPNHQYSQFARMGEKGSDLHRKHRIYLDPVYAASAPACDSVLGNVDGDNVADLVGIGYGSVYVWKGAGNGEFMGPVAELPFTGSRLLADVVVRDMDLDGHPDIVLPGLVLYGNSEFQFLPVELPTEMDRYFVGDFDADGVPDIAAPGRIFFGERDRSFVRSDLGFFPNCWSGYLYQPGIGDLTGDGKDDVVCSTAIPSVMNVYISNGRDGFLFDHVLVVHRDSASAVSVKDFNGDGRADIAVGFFCLGDVFLFTNDGQGRYTVSNYGTGAGAYQQMIAEDFNRDGKPDLLLLDYFSGGLLLHK